jgi:putative nucleotidyltransferase with HDIG domain
MSNSPEEIKAALQNIDKLAPLPSLVKSVLDLSRNPDASARDLTEIIIKEQALTAKILKIVNSAYYGFYREIGNVNHAIVILGFNEIKNITLAACIIQSFPVTKNDMFNRDQFWLHTLGVAYTSSMLSKYVSSVSANDAFVVGLLHDLGKVVLDQHFHDKFIEILTTAQKTQSPLTRVSTEMIGINHAEIGGLLAESWEFPVPLVRAIRYHHDPSKAEKEDFNIHLAHIANYFTHKHQIGDSGNPIPDSPYKHSLRSLGLTLGKIEELWESKKKDFERLNTIL